MLVDSKSGHKPIPGLAPVPYLPAADRARRDKQQFDNWSTFRGFQSGRFVLNDYDYEKPSANLIADADHSGGYAHGSMEMYDYPGRYDDQGEGKTLAKVRLEADQAKDQRRVAHGITPSLFPGGTMTLERHPADSENIEYLVLRASHSYSAQGYRSGGGGDGAYTGSYEMASSERPFRSPLLTRKSVIQGPQTAKVVGQQGEEIDVDKEGRILVQFYWDRKKKTSRRVRVGQIWAGKYQRALFIPRIGDEVVVQYLEGDPDRPMVVGCVYNADNTPPTTLPDNKTQSGINSESSKGHSGYNHLVFEDKAGQEWLKVRAQKDLIVHALNDETRNIDVDQTEKIGNNVTKSVGNNETINVGATYSLTAVQEIVLTVGMSSLTITPGSITLSSPTITFTATSVLSSTAPATSIVADGMLSLTSAAIALNGPTVVQPGLAVNGAMAWTSAVGPPPVPAPAA